MAGGLGATNGLGIAKQGRQSNVEVATKNNKAMTNQQDYTTSIVRQQSSSDRIVAMTRQNCNGSSMAVVET